MYYIKHGSDNFTMIDCCMPEADRGAIINEIQTESRNKGVIRFISTHPDNDHIFGLADLDEVMGLLNFYCVDNQTTKSDDTRDFQRYCDLRDDGKKAFHVQKGCSRKWMNREGNGRGSSGIFVIWPDVANEHYKAALSDAKAGRSPNNISCIVKYSVQDGATMLWLGDLETDFMERLEDAVDLPQADVLFASHHGRDTGKLPTSWLEAINPKTVVLGEAPSRQLNYYSGYNTITQNSAGTIAIVCELGKVHFYVSERDYSVSFLDDEGKADVHGKYIGSLGV
jgi:hypothetical protein